MLYSNTIYKEKISNIKSKHLNKKLSKGFVLPINVHSQSINVITDRIITS